MTELWLKFRDTDGEEKRVAVDEDAFIIGRHSANNLSIVDSRLSRQHVKIERFGDIFVAQDCGSSNGTTINDAALKEPVALKNEDLLNLGGVQIAVEISSDQPAAVNGNGSVGSGADAPAIPGAAANPLSSQMAAAGAPAAAPSAGGIPKSVFLIAPLLGIIILAFAGGLIFLLSGNRQADIVSSGNDFQYSTNEDDDDPSNERSAKQANDTKPTPASGNTTSSPLPDTPTNSSDQPPAQNLSETQKIEQNGASFLRRIAQNDPRAFLTSEQAQRLQPKIKQFGSSSAVADNINSARKNAEKIKSLAASKNLKPQFLAVAAIAKLGANRGDVVQTAGGLVEVLDKLSIQIGNEMADDSLLVIAAYDQGAAGETMKLRNMLQELANKSSASSREIRTIWFLQKNGSITQAEFEKALTFLAIGTIAQNPKEFGVNAEALAL